MGTPDLGYFLHPPRRESEPGYSQLDVTLAAVPSKHHFDPEAMHLMVISPHQGNDELVVVHPWGAQRSFQCCIGNITLVDPNSKHLTLYTFGGELQIETTDEFTQASLRSPAPILLQTGARSEIELLIEEFEALLAQRMAAREDEPRLLNHHLSVAAPLDLYLAMLIALREKYKHITFGEDEIVTKFKHVLRLEIDAVRELCHSQFERSLEELL